MQEKYNHKDIEKLLQYKWEKNNTFSTKKNDKDKFYCLSMFPYPSGELHIGHLRNYTIGDTISRFYNMKDRNVLQVMGWDAFGLPAENAAIKNKVSAAEWTYKNIKNMKEQLKKLGFAYDWDREIITCDSEYYKWEQWLFIQMYKKGLVYRKKQTVNWDPVDKTVLANEQVINGLGWRSNAPVERKQIEQWFIRITKYSKELLEDLKYLNGWPEKIKIMQKNWIGEKTGITVFFKINNYVEISSTPVGIPVFFEKIEFMTGISCLVISGENDILKNIKKTLKKCINDEIKKNKIEYNNDKFIKTHLVAINPLNNTKIPIFICDDKAYDDHHAFAIIPAHYNSDFILAKKNNLIIKKIYEKDINEKIEKQDKLINSGIFDGLLYSELDNVFKMKLGQKNYPHFKILYKIKDWCISRQRFWGSPIPIIYCENCGILTEEMKNLPIILPQQKVIENKVQSLSEYEEFKNIICNKCGGQAERETDTFDTFMESSWYYAKFASKKNNNKIFDDSVNYWLPVDQYIGGIEHAILHLLYARFFNKFMKDIGIIKNIEPFSKLLTQGMVLKDGFKMSKSKGNAVNINTYLNKYGADSLRMFVLFAAPPEKSMHWSENGVKASYKFLQKIWNIVYKFKKKNYGKLPYRYDLKKSKNKVHIQLFSKINACISKVEKDILEDYSFNTAIAYIMETINHLSIIDFDNNENQPVIQEFLNKIVVILNPFIPHITHYLWENLGNKNDIYTERYPERFDLNITQTYIKIIVQIDGKFRSLIKIKNDDKNKNNEQIVLKTALKQKNVHNYLKNKKVKKNIYVKNKLINFVTH